MVDELLGFDEINKTYKSRAIPYKTYFGQMDLTDDQKNERISFSEDTEEMLLYILTLFAVMSEFNAVDEDFIKERLINDYRVVIASYTGIDDYLERYILNFADDFLSSTMDNIGIEWYTSNDRAMFDSENEANTVLNYKDYTKAIASGYTQKEWRTFKDSRVRKTHKRLDGKTIPIKSLFEVGKTFMRFPKDTQMASNHPEEICGCRCTIHFHK